MAVPSDEFITSFAQLAGDFSVLAEHGITTEIIQETLRWFRDLPRLMLPDSACPTAAGALSESLCASAWKLSGWDGDVEKCLGVPQPENAPPDSHTMILANHTSSEAMATASVLRKLLVPWTIHNLQEVPHILSKDEALPLSSRKLILICTDGIFQQPDVLRIILDAGRLDCSIRPILADESFRFPTAEILEELRPAAEQACGDSDHLLRLISSIFKEISIVFKPKDYSSTEIVLAVKAKEVAQRLLSKKMTRFSTRTTSGIRVVPA